jgi:hypothetical protein
MDFLEDVPEIEANADEIKAVKEYEERKAKNKTKFFSLEEAKKELNLQ